MCKIEITQKMKLLRYDVKNIKKHKKVSNAYQCRKTEMKKRQCYHKTKLVLDPEIFICKNHTNRTENVCDNIHKHYTV